MCIRDRKKGPLVARAGAMAALAATAPLAALAALIEHGPGQETDCGSVRRQVHGAARQANTPAKAASSGTSKGGNKSGQKP